MQASISFGHRVVITDWLKRLFSRTILASLAEGKRIEEILKDFPTLTEQDVRAVIAFAAVSVKEDLPFAATPDIQ